MAVLLVQGFRVSGLGLRRVHHAITSRAIIVLGTDYKEILLSSDSDPI